MRGERILITVAIAAAACGARQRGEPEGPPVVPDTAAEARGERLFHQFCYQCHPGGEAGLGPAINDKPLPKLAIRTQIRLGVGAMPSFSRDVLGDDDVGAIIEYLEDMRKTPASYARD
jgi:mono/diheme cytochrome c family protein